MIATPITDEFLHEFERALHNMKPEVLISASKGHKTFWKDGMLVMDSDVSKTKEENLIWFIEWNKKRSDTFIDKVFQVIREAESLIAPDDIERWVHIFRIKCEDAANSLSQIMALDEDSYWRIFEDMQSKGEIKKASDVVLSISRIIGQCSLSWYQLVSFFENCKKMANLPDKEMVIHLETDYFELYRHTLIPKYISPVQETELKNLLKAYHSPNRIDWLGNLGSLVSTVFELKNKGIIVIPQGTSISQYIINNFTHKGRSVNKGSLSNAISDPNNKP